MTRQEAPPGPEQIHQTELGTCHAGSEVVRFGESLPSLSTRASADALILRKRASRVKDRLRELLGKSHLAKMREFRPQPPTSRGQADCITARKGTTGSVLPTLPYEIRAMNRTTNTVTVQLLVTLASVITRGILARPM